jgi:hypothetical protein
MRQIAFNSFTVRVRTALIPHVVEIRFQLEKTLFLENITRVHFPAISFFFHLQILGNYCFVYFKRQ